VELVRSIFKRLDRLEVEAEKVALVNSTPHTILFVDIQSNRSAESAGTEPKSTMGTWTCRHSAGTLTRTNGWTIEEAGGRMTGRVFRRLERLELRNAPARGITSIPIRVLLVDREKGLTGVLLLDGSNTTTSVSATAEEEASFREGLARRPMARMATDMSISRAQPLAKRQLGSASCAHFARDICNSPHPYFMGFT
jgi:hypothetical protein